MAALTGDRNTARSVPGQRNFPVAAGVCIWRGSLVALDATGYARPARATATDIIVGRAMFRADNTGGAAGAISIEVEYDQVIALDNSGGGDAIALTDIGKDCYAVDDHTVALTDNSAARPKAGKIQNVTTAGVWLAFDR